MTSESDQNRFKGLAPQKPETFPKTCPKCGIVFQDLEEFIAGTQELPHSTGLKDYRLGEAIVFLFRNCVCESTLTVACVNRRDLTPDGDRCRKQFEVLVAWLQSKGLDAVQAHERVLTSLRKNISNLENWGVPSDLLEL